MIVPLIVALIGAMKDRLLIVLSVLSLLMCPLLMAQDINPDAPSHISSTLEESQRLNEIQKLFRENAVKDARAQIESFIQRFPKSSFLYSVENILGLLLLKDKDFNGAIQAFKKAVDPRPNQSKFNQYILYNLAATQFEIGQILEAKNTIQNIQPELFDQPTRAKYAALKSKVEVSPYSQVGSIPNLSANSKVSPGTVGVMLPLHGKLARFGLKSLQAIQLAFELFDDAKFTLVIEDSGDTPDQTLQALDRLALKRGVVAVIGPMLTKGIDQVSAHARELGVPLISLARRASATNEDFVFQAGFLEKFQAQEVARQAIEKLGLKKFVIVYPDEKLGAELGENFWDAVEQAGGQIVGAEAYSPGQTDFRTVVDKLSGLFYSGARQAELNYLAKDRLLNKITKRTRKTEHYFQLKPIVDYDAVFIADDSNTAALVIPTFAYRDIDHVNFLGTASWDTPDFISRTQGFAEGSYFTDPFFNAFSSGVGKKFAAQYQDAFGQEPSVFETVAYDAALILKSVLASHPSASREDVRDLLQKSIHDFPGAAGLIRYQDRNFVRSLKLVTVRAGQFQEVAK